MDYTTGANTASFDHWGGRQFKLKEYYDALEDYRYQSIDPSVIYKCKEGVLNWLDKQEVVLGAVFNINDEDILNAMQGKVTRLVINWNKNFIREKEKYSRLYAMLSRNKKGPTWSFTIDEDGNVVGLRRSSGRTGTSINPIKIFYQRDEALNWPNAMHHKFLIGLENAKNIESRTMIYGTYNMSDSTPNNLDSVLLFRQNQRLISHFKLLAIQLHDVSINWNLIDQYGVKKAIKISKQLKERYAERGALASAEPALDDA